MYECRMITNSTHEKACINRPAWWFLLSRDDDDDEEEEEEEEEEGDDDDYYRLSQKQKCRYQ